MIKEDLKQFSLNRNFREFRKTRRGLILKENLDLISYFLENFNSKGKLWEKWAWGAVVAEDVRDVLRSCMENDYIKEIESVNAPVYATSEIYAGYSFAKTKELIPGPKFDSFIGWEDVLQKIWDTYPLIWKALFYIISVVAALNWRGILEFTKSLLNVS